jgi:hypothetical protein
MNNAEMSNTFDVLYNNITSNQAPGLDEYEKSVFLTKAQDEIVKAYFNPRLNKTMEGFDGNERRQIDFSMILRSIKYLKVSFTVTDKESTDEVATISNTETLDKLVKEQNGKLYSNQFKAIDQTKIKLSSSSNNYVATPFLEPFFDYRDNTKSVLLDSDILMFVNEYVIVNRSSNKERLTVIPLTYTEYTRLMSKPYKRPLKFQSWRILDNSASDNSATAPVKKAELVIGPNDELLQYVARYVKKPRAIRLITFDEVTLDGDNTEQSCELDPILHEEIVQRAVELAKAAYTGDLNSQIALGQSSQTNVGAVASQQSR